MARYKLMALVVVARIVEGECPEDVDAQAARLSIHDFTEVEWIDTNLLVEDEKHLGQFLPVEEWAQGDLFERGREIADVSAERE